MVANKIKNYLKNSIFLFLILPIAFFMKNAYAIEQCVLISNFSHLQTNAWWLQQASFGEFTLHQRYMSLLKKHKNIDWNAELFPLAGHQLSVGKGDALTYRSFFSGFPQITDSSSIILITITTLKPLIGEGEISLGGADATAFVTTGNPSLHDFCTGYAVSGYVRYASSSINNANFNPPSQKSLTLKLLGIEEGVYAQISIEVDRVDPENLWPEKCKRCIFDANLVFNPNNIQFVNKAFFNP